jgi:hypothetical protein
MSSFPVDESCYPRKVLRAVHDGAVVAADRSGNLDPRSTVLVAETEPCVVPGQRGRAEPRAPQDGRHWDDVMVRRVGCAAEPEVPRRGSLLANVQVRLRHLTARTTASTSRTTARMSLSRQGIA